MNKREDKPIKLVRGDGSSVEDVLTLSQNAICDGETLWVLQSVLAGAFSPREARLDSEWQFLQDLNRESENVQVDAINVLPGAQPEEFQVTFRCRGILRIDEKGKPQYGTLHKCRMKCGANFPSRPPEVIWETEIWHPNIDHKRKSVCVNDNEWVGGMSLVDLCRQLFEMVQYKNYHAEAKRPYPLDGTVAQWVLTVAEPNGIVDKSKGISVDNRPFEKAKPKGILKVRAPQKGKAAGLIKVKTQNVNLTPQVTVNVSTNDSRGSVDLRANPPKPRINIKSKPENQ